MAIIHIVGARPQFVKMAVVSRAITVHNNRGTQGDRIEELIIHTGQHYDENMSTVFFEELEIPKPNYNLGIGSASQGAQTGRMLEAIETMLVDEQPDWVLLYGDTNSTLALAHIEAGLRSFNRKMPEEINRVLTDHASSVLFCPTEAAVKNLKREGFTNIVNDGHLISDLHPLSLLATGSTPVRVNNELRTTNYAPLVVNIGDVMYDSVLQNVQLAEQRSEILTQLHLKPENYALATVHRASNTDDPERVKAIFNALSEMAAKVSVITPLHPRTQKALRRSLSDHELRTLNSKLTIIEPVPYLDMLLLEKNAKLILTDSGGVQKEAFILKVPCITLREETEWVETVDAGWNVLAGADSKRILQAVDQFSAQRRPERRINPYGDGQASERIVKVLLGRSG